MVYTAESDPLCYPGSSVLRNLLDLEDQTALDEAELALFLTRADEPLPRGRFDARHYRAFHRHLFQDVYPWAGELRTIRIGKGGNWFCYPEHIETELRKAFAVLGRPDRLRELSPDALAAKTV